MAAAGRFAPTPSGPLHFGSLVAALASFCQARAQQARWLLRIEDVDTPRVVSGAADRLQRDLESFGFEWDGPVLRQSDQFEQYRHYLDILLEQGDCFACECSRKTLREQGVASGPLGQIYPGKCRNKGLARAGHSIRLSTAGAGEIRFDDVVYGNFGLDLDSQVGDFVLRRVDGVYAYHLAVVVDDALQGIDEIVRGADLLENTCLHLWLQQKLGFARPRYLHIPLVGDARGAKVSKQTGAESLDPAQAPQQLVAALQHLGQSPPAALNAESPEQILDWAVAHWDVAPIPAKRPAFAETFED